MQRHKKRQTQYTDNSGYSLYQLANFNQNLKNDCEETYRLREQIKLEKSTYGKLNKNITQSINKIQNEGTYFAARLEEERNKYVSDEKIQDTLTSLVDHYEKAIYSDKLSKYEDSKNKKEADQSEETNGKLRLIEKQYDHIVLKANSSSYEVTKKIDQVRMLRSERSILNGLFDQFQRQLFELQLKYKQTVIERSFLENIYKERTCQFEYIQTKMQEEEEKLQKNMHNNRNNENQSMQREKTEIGNAPQSANRKINLNSIKGNESTAFNTLRINKQKKAAKTRRHEQQTDKGRNQHQHLQKMIEYERKVKQMMYNLQIKKVWEIPEAINNLSYKITCLYDKAEFLYEKIYEKKEKLSKVKGGNQKIQTKKELTRGQVLMNINTKLEKEKQKGEKQINSFVKDIDSLKKQLKLVRINEGLDEDITIIDKHIVSMFPKINTNNSYIGESNVKPSQQRLNIILNKNKITKTTAKIYTQQDLIAISRFNLREENCLSSERGRDVYE